MHRTVLRTALSCAPASPGSHWRCSRPGSRAPRSSGAMVTTRGPEVVEVTTDTPLAELPSSGLPRHAGSPVDPAPAGCASPTAPASR